MNLTSEREGKGEQSNIEDHAQDDDAIEARKQVWSAWQSRLTTRRLSRPAPFNLLQDDTTGYTCIDSSDFQGRSENPHQARAGCDPLRCKRP